MKNPIFEAIAANKLSAEDCLLRFRQIAECKSEKKIERLKNEILMANLGLVISGCKRFFSYKGLESDDLIQEGIMGLRMAIDKFDVSKNFQFSTYAHWWIKQRVRKYLEAQNMDKIRSNSMSLDKSFTDDNDSKALVDMLVDVHQTAEAIEENDEISLVKRVADQLLTERERIILNLRYGI